MANGDANIDLLFRNGLKDLEVLPPVKAWNNILPVIRRKQRPVIILRTAALIAVLLSLSFIGYWWNRGLNSNVEIPLIAMGDESVQPRENVMRPATDRKLPSNRFLQVKDNGILNKVDSTIIEAGNTVTDDPDFVTENNYLLIGVDLTAPGKVIPLPESRFEPGINTDYSVIDQFTSDLPKRKTDRWSVMAMASPTYYLRSMTGSNNLSEQISSSEQSQISYSGGVAFAYNITRRLSIQSGVYYSAIGHEVSGINSFAGFRPFDYTKGDENFKVLTSSGLIFANNADVFLLDKMGDRVLTRYTNDIFDPAKANLSYISSSLHQNFSYLEMPVILRYKLIDKNIDFNLIGGLSYNLLVNNTVHTIMDGSRYSVGTTALNSFMVSSSLGMGMEYNLNEKFSLNLEPTFRYYLNPFGLIPGIKANPYSFGIFSGVSYKF